MYYERGAYPRGHCVPCKHCGCSSAEHALGESEVDESEVRRKGYGVSFFKCDGYEPKNMRKWERAENAYQREGNSRTLPSQVISSRKYMFGTFILR